MKVAILDDYQNVSLTMADWSAVAEKAEIVVFSDHVSGLDAVVERLLPFEVVCVMRERTPLPREVLERLPRLRLIASTGPRNAPLDMAAAQRRRSAACDERLRREQTRGRDTETDSPIGSRSGVRATYRA
jgi:phosphoglycerate dehydrogenase-like enzyme